MNSRISLDRMIKSCVIKNSSVDQTPLEILEFHNMKAQEGENESLKHLHLISTSTLKIFIIQSFYNLIFNIVGIILIIILLDQCFFQFLIKASFNFEGSVCFVLSILSFARYLYASIFLLFFMSIRI